MPTRRENAGRAARHYIITIHSPDMTPFKGVDENGLVSSHFVGEENIQKNKS